MSRVLITRSLIEGGTDPLVTAGHEVVYPRAEQRDVAVVSRGQKLAN